MSKDSSAKYYKKTKRGFKKARERYEDLFEEEKNKKRQCNHERYNNLSEDTKQRLVKYRNNY